MKKIYNLFVFAAFAVAAACSDEGEKTGVTDPAAGNLQFVTRTPQAASGRGPVYDTGGFRILAFRNTGSDYVYMQDVPLIAPSGTSCM